jgi:polyisoprenoid-binding protein YceI
MNARRALPILGFLSAVTVCLALARPQAPTKGAPPAAAAGSYQVDPVHSTVIYRIKHLNTSWSYGRFDKISGTVAIDTAKPEKSSVSVEIDVGSLDTGNKKRDSDVKGPDFFDAVQFPTATFASKTVKKTAEGKYSVSGEFNLHGVKKPLTVDFEEIGHSDTKMGVRAGYYGVFVIKRSDFGMKVMPDAVGDDVQVTVSIEGTQTESAGK